MYESFKVSNFRGLRDFSIGSLERVNLIAGKNDVGKTTLLEAFWLHHGPNLPRLGLTMGTFRGLDGVDPAEPFRDLFWSYDSELCIELRSEEGDGRSSTLRMTLADLDVSSLLLGTGGEGGAVSQPASVSGRYSSQKIVMEYTDQGGEAHVSEGWVVERQLGPGIQGQALESKTAGLGKRPLGIYLAARFRVSNEDDANRFGQLEMAGEHRKVVSLLKRIEPRLQRLTIVPRMNVPTIHAELAGDKRLVPLALVGDGMARLASLALAIGNARDGIVLVDEIENGLHHSALQTMWSGVARFAREFNVQLIATTHSEECIRAAHAAFSPRRPYDFRLHRLENRDGGNVQAVTYDRDTLKSALEVGLEVR